MSVIAFADNLKRFRITRGISKSELARRIGVSDATVHKWEAGTISPRMGKIEMIARILNITVDDLLFGVSVEPPIRKDEVFNRVFTSLLNQTKCSEVKLAKKLKTNQSTIKGWESGDVIPDIIQLKEIADFFNVNPLIFVDENYEKKTHKDTSTYIDTRESIQIPLYGTIHAGEPLEMLEAVDHVEVPPSIAIEYPDAFFLEVSGDSMSKVVPDGAYALINPCVEVSNGEIAAVVVNGFDATLKRFYKLHNSVVLEPDSYNSEHSPKVYELNKDVSATINIIGKMVWFMPPLNVK